MGNIFGDRDPFHDAFDALDDAIADADELLWEMNYVADVARADAKRCARKGNKKGYMSAVRRVAVANGFVVNARKGQTELCTLKMQLQDSKGAYERAVVMDKVAQALGGTVQGVDSNKVKVQMEERMERLDLMKEQVTEALEGITDGALKSSQDDDDDAKLKEGQLTEEEKEISREILDEVGLDAAQALPFHDFASLGDDTESVAQLSRRLEGLTGRT